MEWTAYSLQMYRSTDKMKPTYPLSTLWSEGNIYEDTNFDRGFSPGMSLKLIWNILIPQQFQDIPQNIFFLYLCRAVYEKDRCCSYRRWIVTGEDKYLYRHIFAIVYIILQITVQISWLSIHTWLLTHWGRVMHICVSELTIIVSDNGLSPGRRQAIIWNHVGLFLIEPLGTNFSEISIGDQTFSFKKMHLNMSSGKCWPFCLGLTMC